MSKIGLLVHGPSAMILWISFTSGRNNSYVEYHLKNLPSLLKKQNPFFSLVTSCISLLNVTCDYSYSVMPNSFDIDYLTILCPIVNDLLRGNFSHIIAQMLALLHCVIYSSLLPSFWSLEILGITWLVAESL